jgi:hypothetical protein
MWLVASAHHYHACSGREPGTSSVYAKGGVLIELSRQIEGVERAQEGENAECHKGSVDG